MIPLLLRIAINATALWVAAELIDGIELSDRLGWILLVAVLFGVVNAALKPVAQLLTFPLIVFTLGLFTLVINALLLQLTDALTAALTVDGFGTSLLGAAVISSVSWLLSVFIPDGERSLVAL